MSTALEGEIKLITLMDAFLSIARAGYPQHPAYMDEIRDERDLFHSHPGVRIAKAARTALENAILNQRVRLWGRDGSGLHEDIDLTEVTYVNVLRNTVTVLAPQPWPPTYREVHCYIADVWVLMDEFAADVEALVEQTDNANKAANGQAEQARETSVVSKPSGVQTNKQAALKAKCIAWIAALPEYPPRRKLDVKVEAIAAIHNLSGRQFDAAWDEAAPASWKIPGPK
jgi:hypothetical protein